MTALQIPRDNVLFQDARDKVVILTGGATGIGETTVRLLHSQGAKISFLDLNEKAGNSLQAELGKNVDFHLGSVTTWEDQLAIFEKTIAKHGRIDIVLANAGIDEIVEDSFADVFDDEGHLQPPRLVVLDVNLRGVIYTTKLALSFFRKLGIQGSLVATGSAASYLDTPGIPVYNAAKHGVLGLVRSLRDTLAQEGLVRANVVAPSFVQTPFTAHLIHLWKRNGLPINQPDDVAYAIAFLALNTQYHGKSIYVANGVYTELEDSIQESRPTWFGRQNTEWVNLRKTKGLAMGKQK